MPLARTANVKNQLVTWFTTVLVPEAQPDLRDAYVKRGRIQLPRHPHRTPYLEDNTGALEKVVPSGDWDWVEKHGDDTADMDPVIWTTEPTYDAEGNQLTPGVPAHGWITEPVVDANGFIVEPGVPDPNPTVIEYNWRQFWKGAGFDVPADFPTTPITDGCPDPSTGEWVNSIRLTPFYSPPVFDRNTGAELEPMRFENRLTMRIRYTIDDPDGAPGNREWEVWEEFSWWDVTRDNGQTWENGVDTDWTEVYRGSTAAPATEGP